MECAKNGMCKKWNVQQMEWALNGMCRKWNEILLFDFRHCDLWNAKRV